MPTRQDYMRQYFATQGFTGDLNAQLLQWLKTMGATSDNLSDAWRQMLAIQYPAGSGNMNDDWKGYLASLGHTGNINDSELAFWQNPVAGNPPTVVGPIATQNNDEGDAGISFSVAATFAPGDDPIVGYDLINPPAGITISAAGLVTGTIGQTANDSSPYTVTARAIDSSGRSATNPFTWNVALIAPSAGTAIPTQSDAENGTVNLNVSGNFVSPRAVATYAITNDPAGLSISNLGVITGTIDGLASNFSPYTAIVTLTDVNGRTAQQSFTWNVSEVSPSAGTAIPTQSNGESSVISLNVAGNFNLPTAVQSFALGGTPPSGLSIDNSGLVTGTLTALGSVGSPYSPVVTVTDVNGRTAQQAFTWNVTLVGPALNTPITDQVDVNSATIAPLDVSGNFSLPTTVSTWALLGQPAGLSIDATGTITGSLGATADTGSPYTATVTVTDVNGRTAQDSFTWTVNAAATGAPLEYDFTALNGGSYTDPVASGRTFNEALTFARGGNATMVDSDGLIKWAPHNFLENTLAPNSNPGQGYNGFGDYNGILSITTGVADPIGGNLAITVSPDTDGTQWRDVITTNAVEASPGAVNSSFWLRRRSGSGIIRMLTTSAAAGEVVNLTSSWQQFTFPVRVYSSGTSFIGLTFSAAGDEIDVAFPSCYRTDLGGMVPNPDPLIPSDPNFVGGTAEAAVYLPRIGHHVYNGTTWDNKGLLIESAGATNVIDYSQDFSQAGVYTDVNVTPIPSAVDSPTGEKYWEIRESGGDTNHYIYGLTGTTTGAWTASLVCRGNGRRVYLRVFGQGSSTLWATFDLTSGTVPYSGGSALTGTTIESLGNGDYKISISSSVALSAGDGIEIGLATDTDTGERPTYPSNGTSGIYATAIQVEEGEIPTSYIPTNGATATRNAETLTVPIANQPYSSTGWTMAIRANMGVASGWVSRLLALGGGANGSRLNSDESASWTVTNTVDGFTTPAAASTNVGFGPMRTMNGALKATPTTITGSINGTLGSNTYGTTGSTPAYNNATINLAYTLSDNRRNIGTIESFKIWDTAIDDADLVTETTP